LAGENLEFCWKNLNKIIRIGLAFFVLSTQLILSCWLQNASDLDLLIEAGKVRLNMRA
jgi:hypothetical protein